jgi:hypothetical protein
MKNVLLLIIFLSFSACKEIELEIEVPDCIEDKSKQLLNSLSPIHLQKWSNGW